MNIIDLTHIINEDMPVFPGTEKPILENVCTLEKNGFREKLMTMYSHTGTHMDAPGHMLVGGKLLDNFDVSTFIGPAVVIDCSNVNHEIGIDILKSYESEIRACDFVLLYTGWDKKWGTDDYFVDFPALTLEACLYIIEFDIKGIGVDTISIDLFESKSFEIHKNVLDSEMVIIENLKNLEELIGKRHIFSGLPLKIEKADGSPIRAVAYSEK